MLQVWSYAVRWTFSGHIIRIRKSHWLLKLKNLSILRNPLLVCKKGIWSWRCSVCILLYHFSIKLRNTGFKSRQHIIFSVIMLLHVSLEFQTFTWALCFQITWIFILLCNFEMNVASKGEKKLLWFVYLF